jgi:pyruvate,water dikinase
MAPRYIAVEQQYGNAYSFWKQFGEPRIKQAAADLDAMGTDADLRTAAETLFYGFHQTFTCLGLLFIPNMQLGAILAQHNVEDAELIAHELTQGGDNATQDIDEEIWRLAEDARENQSVTAILSSTGDDALDALRREPAAATFVAGFDDLIRRHGRRSQGWMLSCQTWAERPEAALSLIRAQVAADRVSPDEVRERSAGRRQAATERVLSALPPDKHDEFHRVIKQLDGYVNIREGRAYWQLTVSGAMRGLLLRIGDDLVRRNRIGARDDIFYLTPEDIASNAPDLRPVVSAARAEHERWRHIEPPSVIGTPGEVTANSAEKRAAFKGSPASRGEVIAPIRILLSPEEGSKLKRGDILVAPMTTPAWTPLFAIAGGIITETGGALSHPAITAREYGIPAVVALEDATTRLRDGQVVKMDGASGDVIVLS